MTVIMVFLALGGDLLACPTCKNGLANDPSTANIARGYFWSIIFMMSMPFLILTGLGSYFYYEIRKARKNAVPTIRTPQPKLA